MDQRSREAAGSTASAPHARVAFAAAIYVVAFVTGAIVMSFEMLGSRYLNPYFGSGIYTWAALISTVLAALCVGYFLGGWLADRHPSPKLLGISVMLGSLYVLVLPVFAERLLELLLDGIDDIRAGSLLASFVIMFVPVTLLGMYSPFAIRLLLSDAQRSGVTSGTVYGVSTAGSIAGTLGTTFLLIPLIGSRAITIALGIAGLLSGLVLIVLRQALHQARRAPIAVVAAIAAAFAAGDAVGADALIDPQIRAAMLAHKDGEVAHIETSYNDIFIAKKGHILSLSFQLKGWDYTQSEANLRDPDDLPVPYTRSMTTALVYPEELKSILMIGLGGGSISTYLGRFVPDAAIDVVEVDPGVTAAARTYFGMRESERVRYLEGDGRVFLNRHKDLYDLIIVDAFHGGYVPFHLLTKEFYALVKQRLTPKGAVAFNVHDGTKLYWSTLRTLQAVFPSVHLYPSGAGEVIVVVTAEPAPDALAQRAAALQDKLRLRFPLPELVARRAHASDTAAGELLTDDFAPADLYNAVRDSRRRKK